MFKGYLTKTGAIVNIPPSLQASDTMIKKADEIKAANTELYKDRFDRSYDLLLVRQNYRIGLWFTLYTPRP
jgi:hypothetical protein